jgi:predicted nuclease of predicted toxin-antitoxin system
VKILLDESADARLQPYLRSNGYDASRIAREHPAGLPDREVLALAVAEQRILLTADHDFGELVFRQGQAHEGVILFRLGDYAASSSGSNASNMCSSTIVRIWISFSW